MITRYLKILLILSVLCGCYKRYPIAEWKQRMIERLSTLADVADFVFVIDVSRVKSSELSISQVLKGGCSNLSKALSEDLGRHPFFNGKKVYMALDGANYLTNRQCVLLFVRRGSFGKFEIAARFDMGEIYGHFTLTEFEQGILTGSTNGVTNESH